MGVAAGTPVISKRRQITRSWLTGALRAAGHLPAGNVRTLVVEPWRSQALSELYRVEATYSRKAAQADLPSIFILKVARPDETSVTANRRRWKEHEFYTRVAAAMDDPPIPRVFAATYDSATRHSHVLLADLSASHVRPPTPLPPTPNQLRADIDCLARIHAWWWEHADLGGAATERNDAWVAQRTAASQRRLDRFLAEFGDHLPESTHTALRAAIAALPAILQRSARAPLTIVHGDAHPWNFLTSHEPDDGEACLLDWEGWSIEPGPHDLASLLALHLPVEERRALEDELLERYALRLRERGVTDYGLAACRDDYRRAVARRVLSPVGMWSRGSRSRAWWPALEHVTAAFHDLRCEDVL